jgi:hypothetical protein
MPPGGRHPDQLRRSALGPRLRPAVSAIKEPRCCWRLLSGKHSAISQPSRCTSPPWQGPVQPRPLRCGLQAMMLTSRGAARLRTFPDASEFEGSMRGCFHHTGNSIPPLLSWASRTWSSGSLGTLTAFLCVLWDKTSGTHRSVDKLWDLPGDYLEDGADMMLAMRQPSSTVKVSTSVGTPESWRPGNLVCGPNLSTARDRALNPSSIPVSEPWDAAMPNQRFGLRDRRLRCGDVPWYVTPVARVLAQDVFLR